MEREGRVMEARGIGKALGPAVPGESTFIGPWRRVSGGRLPHLAYLTEITPV